MQSTVLILGARGRFGMAVARAFAEAGWRVVAQMRPGAALPTELAAETGIESLGLDLADTAALAQAAQGASIVVHALNPAYTNKAWKTGVLPMMEAAIAVTRALNATLMMPGNVYNFGADMPHLLTEDTPQRARTVKGQIRIAMEAQLERSGVRGVVIRSGDFFGSGKGTWFDTTIVTKLAKGVFTYPGPRDVATAWAYLPDLARTFVAVAAQRARLRPFEVLHFSGYSLTAQQWLEALHPIARQQGWVKAGGQVRLSTLPWPIIRVGALVLPTWAALMEMAYLWRTPHALANTRLTHLIGAEPHTPLAVAAKAALADLGYLPSAPVHGTQRLGAASL